MSLVTHADLWLVFAALLLCFRSFLLLLVLSEMNLRQILTCIL